MIAAASIYIYQYARNILPKYKTYGKQTKEAAKQRENKKKKKKKLSLKLMCLSDFRFIKDAIHNCCVCVLFFIYLQITFHKIHYTHDVLWLQITHIRMIFFLHLFLWSRKGAWKTSSFWYTKKLCLVIFRDLESNITRYVTTRDQMGPHNELSLTKEIFHILFGFELYMRSI